MESPTLITVENGKDLRISPDPKHTGYVIDFVNGGQVPECLLGRWTSLHKAKQVANLYLSQRGSKPNGSKRGRKRVSDTK